jgi:hypothetical protein
MNATISDSSNVLINTARAYKRAIALLNEATVCVNQATALAKEADAAFSLAAAKHGEARDALRLPVGLFRWLGLFYHAEIIASTAARKLRLSRRLFRNAEKLKARAAVHGAATLRPGN